MVSNVYRRQVILTLGALYQPVKKLLIKMNLFEQESELFFWLKSKLDSRIAKPAPVNMEHYLPAIPDTLKSILDADYHDTLSLVKGKALIEC
jgi:hypothetical protein